MARQSKRSPERRDALLNALRLGNTRRNAAAYAEISHETFYNWLADDVTFRDAVEKAEADAEARFVGQVAKAAADGTWQAAAWWLERRRADDYRRRDGVELTGKNGGAIETRTLTEGMDDHERATLRDLIDSALAAAPEPAAGDPV